jgi:hypothetical protein
MAKKPREFVELTFKLKFRRDGKVFLPSKEYSTCEDGNWHDLRTKCLMCYTVPPPPFKLDPVDNFGALSPEVQAETIKTRAQVRALLSVALAFVDADFARALTDPDKDDDEGDED